MAVRRAKGSLESEVLAALWAAGGPLTPAQVADAVDADLAYTTVQTILTRLHAKGAVTRETVGRAHAYTAVLDDAGIAAHRMQELLERGGDHAAVLSHFLGALTAEDAATLSALLAEQRPARQER
jgi:predicted transcriptional regulator